MNGNEFWFAMEVVVKPQASEAIEFAFNNLNSLGTEINNFRSKQERDVCVIGYFDHEIDGELVERHLADALRIYGFSFEIVVSVTAKVIENQDWLAEWKKHWKPTETDKFIIAPTREEISDTEKIIIRIEPNMAFGTGTHETTRLCLKAIEENYHARMSFLDVGTGTGILSIAVSKLAADDVVEIVGCDVDPDSVRIAKENSLLNDTAGIEFYARSISPEMNGFDFICANLTANVIIPILPLLTKKAKQILVLSGILIEQEGEVRGALEKLGMENAEIRVFGKWISIIIKK